MKNYSCFGQLSLFDFVSDLNASDPIIFFDSHFYNGYHFLYGVSRTPVSVYDMQIGDKFFKMWFDDFGFWHHCYKKSYNFNFFEID